MGLFAEVDVVIQDMMKEFMSGVRSDMNELLLKLAKKHKEKEGNSEEASEKEESKESKEQEPRLNQNAEEHKSLESASKNAESEKTRLLQLQNEGTFSTIKSTVTTNDDRDKDNRSRLGEAKGIANFREVFESDDSNDREVETPADSPHSEEEQSYRSEGEARSDWSGVEDVARNSEDSEHSEAETNESGDVRRNEFEVEQNDHSLKEESNRSDVALEGSRQSDEEEDKADAASVRFGGVASDNEASEGEEEHSDREWSEHSVEDASRSDVEREGSDRPDQSDAEVEGSVHQDIGDAEPLVHQGVNDAERWDHREEGGDRHSEHSARSRSPQGSKNEGSERQARSGSASDNESVFRKIRRTEESGGSNGGSDSDAVMVCRKRRKQRAENTKVQNLPAVAESDVEQGGNLETIRRRLLCVSGSVSCFLFIVTAVLLGTMDSRRKAGSPKHPKRTRILRKAHNLKKAENPKRANKLERTKRWRKIAKNPKKEKSLKRARNQMKARNLKNQKAKNAEKGKKSVKESAAGRKVCYRGTCTADAECLTDENCQLGHICEDHKCFVACRSSGNCPVDQGCFNRRCENTCNLRGTYRVNDDLALGAI